jgi:hypothetical protein
VVFTELTAPLRRRDGGAEWHPWKRDDLSGDGLHGGWRSLPWPFGLFDVAPASLKLRSWHWRWWGQG